MMLPSFIYQKPGSLAEAIRLLDKEGARLHAGGTDLLGCMRDGVFEAEKVVSIRQLKDLKGIRERKDKGLSIGPLTTLTELARNRMVLDRYPGLAMAAAEVASPQLRNQGTLGGNLCQKPRCWYYRGQFHCLRKGGDTCFALAGENQFHCIFGGSHCYIVHPSDTAPMLCALGARLRIAGPRGRRTVPVETFHVRPADDPQRETVLERGEMITEIILPPPAVNLKTSYRKIRARRSWDFALAGAALAIELNGEKFENPRVFLSGVAPVPWRAIKVEQAIQGNKPEEGVILKAAAAAVQNAAPLALNGYKIRLVRGMMIEELQKITAETSNSASLSK